MADVGISITVEGTILSYAFGKASKSLTQGGAKSPAGIIKNIANGIIKNVALFGEKDVKDQLYPGHGVDTGMLRRSISGRLIKDFQGQVDPGSVYYAYQVEHGWPSGKKGYQMFANSSKNIKQFQSSDQYDQLVDREIKRWLVR